MSKKEKKLLERMQWLNPPQEWRIESNALSMVAQPKSDFWKNTHYGYSFDSGSFYYTKCKGEFEVSTSINGAYEAQYDQMGLMIRIDDKTWLKTGVEFVNNNLNISVVSTNTNSDWSMIQLDKTPNNLRFKVIRKSDALEVFYAINNEEYSMIRLAYFPEHVECMVGLMSASPRGKGFNAIFTDFDLKKLS